MKEIIQLISIIASITTIASFVLYIKEKHKREKAEHRMLGFLKGIKVTSESIRKSASEASHHIGSREKEYFHSMVRRNVSDGEYLTKQINDELSILQKKSTD